MKRIISIVIIAALLITGLAACNRLNTKSKTPNIQADTLGMHHIMETGEIYTCKMHNEVMSDHLGTCPKCGMKLVKQKMTPEQEKMIKEGTYVKPKD